MRSFSESIEKLKEKISGVTKSAFISAFVCGLLTHMVVMVGDFPNHDGLGSLYFNQNMIESGRWFLTVPCGISSYFSLPWLIGLLSLLYIAISAGLVCAILKIKSSVSAAVIGALMATFPALASTFAYVFTMDGYMFGLMLGILAVYITGKYKKGWIAGAVLLAFSIGSYQAYLPVVIILCMYAVALIICEKETAYAVTAKGKILAILRYLYMGICGGVLYFVVLKVLLKIEGVTIGSYQGGSALAGAGGAASTEAAVAGGADAITTAGAEAASAGLIGKIASAYKDFAAFTVKSDILAPNVFAWTAVGVLACVAAVLLIREIVSKKWYKSAVLYIAVIVIAVVLPLATNIVMIVLGNVTYHAIMRYQWVMIPVCIVAIIDNITCSKDITPVQNKEGGSKDAAVSKGEAVSKGASAYKALTWLVPICGAVLVFCYIVTDNIGYSNLQKKYERTYAYCERLLDRIEQTDGYYKGIPIAMIGVVSEDQYPKADLTEGITDNMLGLSGDYLCYKAEDYRLFMKAYLGADLNFIVGDEMADIYNSKEYVEMDSFPGKDSVKMVGDKIYVKTENIDYGLREKYSISKED
ncbi:MAG: glucosyltransferase domain-containing protein [Lachnospiraceae bacterium]|nr:glucosyltransferase domain-containing protein [Lachnospiraceae bacterium]